MKQSLLYQVLPIFLLLGCSSSQYENNDMEIKTRKMESWVNLMPGSKPSFYFSGSIIITNNENVVIDSIRMLNCYVMQDGKTLYELHPEFNFSGNILEPIFPGKDRIYTFSLSPGAPIQKELNLEKPVSLELNLTALNRVKHYKIDSITVVKAF